MQCRFVCILNLHERHLVDNKPHTLLRLVKLKPTMIGGNPVRSQSKCGEGSTHASSCALNAMYHRFPSVASECETSHYHHPSKATWNFFSNAINRYLSSFTGALSIFHTSHPLTPHSPQGKMSSSILKNLSIELAELTPKITTIQHLQSTHQTIDELTEVPISSSSVLFLTFFDRSSQLLPQKRMRNSFN